MNCEFSQGNRYFRNRICTIHIYCDLIKLKIELFYEFLFFTPQSQMPVCCMSGMSWLFIFHSNVGLYNFAGELHSGAPHHPGSGRPRSVLSSGKF